MYPFCRIEQFAFTAIVQSVLQLTWNGIQLTQNFVNNLTFELATKCCNVKESGEYLPIRKINNHLSFLYLKR